MKSITVTSVTVVGAGVTIVGTIADTDFVNPAVQISVPAVPSSNPRFWRTVRVSDEAVFTQRNGANPVAIPIGSVTAIALALESSLTFPPYISTQPVAASTSFASGVLTSNATIPNDGDQVVLNTKTYTFKTALTPTEGQVLIGADAATALDNLKLAVNRTDPGANDGVKYKIAAAHTTVQATTNTDTTQLFVALAVGTAANAYAFTTTGGPRLVCAAATLLGGTAAATFTTAVTSEVTGLAYQWQYADATAKAVATLTSDTVIPVDGDTVTIGNKVYTFKTALTPTEGEVLIGGSAAVALDNLKSAMNHTGTPDVDYKCAAAHTQFEATTNTATTQVIQALVAGTAANAYVLSEDSIHLSWGTATAINGGWSSATGTVNGCVYTNDTTVTLTCTPTTTGQSGVLHRCSITNAAGQTVTVEVALTIT